MTLEEAKRILKQIYQKTSFEDSATRIALETVLKVLEEYEDYLETEIH